MKFRYDYQGAYHAGDTLLMQVSVQDHHGEAYDFTGGDLRAFLGEVEVTAGLFDVDPAAGTFGLQYDLNVAEGPHKGLFQLVLPDAHGKGPITATFGHYQITVSKDPSP